MGSLVTSIVVSLITFLGINTNKTVFIQKIKTRQNKTNRVMVEVLQNTPK